MTAVVSGCGKGRVLPPAISNWCSEERAPGRAQLWRAAAVHASPAVRSVSPASRCCRHGGDDKCRRPYLPVASGVVTLPPQQPCLLCCTEDVLRCPACVWRSVRFAVRCSRFQCVCRHLPPVARRGSMQTQVGRWKSWVFSTTAGAFATSTCTACLFRCVNDVRTVGVAIWAPWPRRVVNS